MLWRSLCLALVHQERIVLLICAALQDVSASVKAEQRCCCLLFGSLLAQVSSDLRILVQLACNHLSDSGSGEGGH